MIRYSNENDINNMTFLWNEAFGDSEEDIMFFINQKFNPQNTLVYDVDGKIASMLFLLEGNMRINNKMYPSYYLYAACTLNEYRGRGYMSLLLDFAKKTASDRGYYYICLLPASESLYGYYEKYGYKPVFKKKIFTVSSDKIIEMPLSENYDSNNLFSLRENAFKDIDMFVWDNESINFAFEHHKLYGGQALSSCKGYMLHSANGSKTIVKEYCFTEFFGSIKDTENVTFYLPVDYSVNSEDFEIVNSGMILPINKKSEELLKIINNPYLGLTLD